MHATWNFDREIDTQALLSQGRVPNLRRSGHTTRDLVPAYI
jgi:hypothetical protein